MEATYLPNQQMTLLDTIRAEGARKNTSTAHKIGFNYAISILGEFEDFKKGAVMVRLRQRGGESVCFSDLLARGHSVPDIRNMFTIWRRKSWSIFHDGVNPANNDLIEEFRVFQENEQQIRLPILPGGMVTYAQLVGEGLSDDKIEDIFNLHRRKHTGMREGSLRHSIYTEFMKLVANWSTDTYSQSTAASQFPEHLEKHSNALFRPAIRTSFCSLVGRMMTLVRENHRSLSTKRRDLEAEKWKQQQETAWNKQSMKREALKQKMGTDAFNAKKHRDKAASSTRKAAEVTGNAALEQRFIEFRRSEIGRIYDKGIEPSVLSRPKYMNTYGLKPNSLGFTSRANLATFIRNNISKLSNMKIRFDVDPCNIRTTLFQYVAVAGEGVLSLSNTNDFDVKGKTFSITGMLHANDTVYVNLDHRRTTCHRKLPKEWSSFERWSGYGIVGNPQVAVSMPLLIKIVPHNISFFGFSYEEDMYTIGHTEVDCMQMSVAALERGIKDKYARAAEYAAAAAAKAKNDRATEARAAARAKQGQQRYNIQKFPTANEKSNRALKAMLAKQLAEGSIDMQTFKMGMAALG